MGDLTSNRATLRDKFELEKFRSKVKSLSEMESSPSNYDQKQKAMKIEEIVKHMKHLPSYLERGKPIQDRALSFGVMDWARLEKWQHKQGFVRSNKCSPTSTNSSSLFSADGSSPRSSRDQSCSPARQKVNRVTLQSHFKASPKEDCSPHIKLSSQNVAKFHSFEDPLKQSKMGSCHTPPSSCLKGKLKIQDDSVNHDRLKKNENVPFLAQNTHGCTETDGNNNLNLCIFEAINSKNSQMELGFSRNHRSPSRNKTPERKKSTSSSKNSDQKPRSLSPLRRFSFSLRSTMERPDSPVSQTSTHSSPLRRLLDPIFPSKEIRVDDVSRTKAKVKLDFGNEIKVADVLSSRKQALFQTTLKNDRLLYTFAVENDDILAATVTSLTSSGKEDNKNLLYTFFTVHEVKKKPVGWLSHGNKNKDHSYVPNVTAQMKVSNSHYDTREFVLFSVNPNVQPQEELEAIVVKFSRKANSEDNQERFSTTVILPGGSHGVPSKGEPSPLIYRWRSGGVCDCGGWDEGCRLTTLTNQVRSVGSISDKINSNSRQFALFVQGEVQNKKPVFSLTTLRDGIFSIEYNSSLSPLQAFSICISLVESRKMSEHKEFRTHVRNEFPIIYTPVPGIKRNATGKVISS